MVEDVPLVGHFSCTDRANASCLAFNRQSCLHQFLVRLKRPPLTLLTILGSRLIMILPNQIAHASLLLSLCDLPLHQSRPWRSCRIRLLVLLLSWPKEIVVGFHMADVLVDLSPLDHVDGHLLLFFELNEGLGSFLIVIYQNLEVNKVYALDDAILEFNHNLFIMV